MGWEVREILAILLLGKHGSTLSRACLTLSQASICSQRTYEEALLPHRRITYLNQSISEHPFFVLHIIAVHAASCSFRKLYEGKFSNTLIFDSLFCITVHSERTTSCFLLGPSQYPLTGTSFFLLSNICLPKSIYASCKLHYPMSKRLTSANST